MKQEATASSQLAMVRDTQRRARLDEPASSKAAWPALIRSKAAAGRPFIAWVARFVIESTNPLGSNSYRISRATTKRPAFIKSRPVRTDANDE